MIISVSVSKEDLRSIDDYRGDIPRSTFLIRSALKEVGVPDKFYGTSEAEVDGVVAIERTKKLKKYVDKKAEAKDRLPGLCKHGLMYCKKGCR